MTFLTGLVSGCSRDSAVVQHGVALRDNSPVVTMADLPDPNPSNADASLNKFLVESRLADAGRVFGEESDVSRRPLATLLQWESRLFDESIIRDPRSRTESIQRIYYRYNNSVLAGVRNPVERSEYLPLLNRVVDRIMAGCDERLRGCRNIRFFLESGNAKELVLAMVSERAAAQCRAGQSGQAMQLIRTAYALTQANRGTDERRIDLALLDCSVGRLTATASDNSAAARRESNEIVDWVSRILRRRDRFANIPGFTEIEGRFVQDLDPWSFSADRSPDGVFAGHLQRLRSEYLLSNPQIIRSEDFVRHVHTENVNRNDFYLYDGILRKFQEINTPILRNLKIETIEGRDPVFVVIESVATKRWDPRLAAEIFAGLPRGLAAASEENVRRIVKAYVQMMFLRQLVETNTEMGNFYRTSGITSAETIQEAVLKTDTLAKDWDEMYERVGKLREFVGLAMQVPNERLKEFGLDSTELAQASRYLVAFPHMLLLAYELAERRFDIQLRTFFGSFRITYYDILDYVFKGGTEPWFSFSPGRREGRESRLNTYQIFHAIDFAMRTETFKVFQVREEDFLKKLTDLMSVMQESYFTNAIDNLQETNRNFSEELVKIQEFCAEENRGLQARENGETYRPRYRHSIDFYRIEDGLFSQTEWMRAQFGASFRTRQTYSASNGGADWISLHQFSYENTERMDIMRLEVAQKHRYMKMLEVLYQNFRKDKGDSEETIRQNLEYIGTGLRRLEHQRRRYFTLVDQLNRKVNLGCAPLALLRENELVNQMHRDEIEHLRKVYRDKQRILRNETTYAEVIPAYRFSGYESIGYTGRDDFSGDIYRYTKLDAHFRVVRYLDRLGAGLNVAMPTPRNLQLTSAFRDTASYVDVPFYDAQGNLLSEEDFVRFAMNVGASRAGDRRSEFFKWENNLAGMDFAGRSGQWIPHLNALLYRFGEQEFYSAANPGCISPAVPEPGACPVERRKFLDAKTIVEEQAKLAQFLSVKEDEDSLYEIMNIGSKIEYNFMWPTLGGSGFMIFDLPATGNLFNPKTGDLLGFFDFSYQLTIAPLMGISLELPWVDRSTEDRRGYDPKRIPLRDQMRAYFQSKQAMDYMPFQVDARTAESFDATMRDEFAGEVDRAKDLEGAIEEFRREDERRTVVNEAGERVPFRRRIRRNLREPAGFGPYITPRWTVDYERSVRQFHDETFNFFRASRDVR